MIEAKALIGLSVEVKQKGDGADVQRKERRATFGLSPT